MTATLVGHDPQCRYVQRDPGELPLHVCVNREGEMVQPGQDCWYEARRQFLNLAGVRARLEETA